MTLRLPMFNGMVYNIIEPKHGLMCHAINCPLLIDCCWLMTCGMEPMDGDRGSGTKLTWT